MSLDETPRNDLPKLAAFLAVFRVSILVTGAAFLISLLVAGQAAAAPDPTVVAAFDAAKRALGGLPESALNRGQQTSLIRKLDNAEASYVRDRDCTAVNILDAYLSETQALRKGNRTAIAEYSYNLGRAIRHLILEQVVAAPCADLRVGTAPQITIAESNNERLKATVIFGRPILVTVQAGGETWTRLSMPGLEARFGDPGVPAVPFFTTLVAIPNGATVSVTVRPTIAESLHLNLYPVQPPAAMGEPTPDDFFDAPPPPSVFADKPFTKDSSAYVIDAAYPSDICTAEPVGQFRDLRVARVKCAAARYNPASDDLTVFGGVDVEVTFSGGDGTFVTERSLSPFEPISDVLRKGVLNRDVVDKYVRLDARLLNCIGEELLILTPPAMRSSAEALADWKRDKGIVTSVFQVNDGAGSGPDSAAAIRELIRDRYDSCTIRPSYVLLFGDAEYVPTWYVINPVYPDQVIASDFPYGKRPDGLLEFAVGRLPVDPASADLIVAKITSYERSPPGKASFYEKAAIASQFECCSYDPMIFDDVPAPPDGTDQRAFIQVVEDVRDRLLAKGYGVDRIYKKTLDPLYTEADKTPKFYADGTPLPNDLKAPFPWSGSSTDVIDAFNDGRFLMVHLDHGYPGGWVNPSFNSPLTLTNGELLPVVLSFNCSTGYFDDETDGPPNEPLDKDPTPTGYVSFTEKILRNPNGGAIGVIAATRKTFGTGNIMILGALDAALPDLDPTFGSNTPHRRLGEMLTAARVYLALALVGVDPRHHPAFPALQPFRRSNPRDVDGHADQAASCAPRRGHGLGAGGAIRRRGRYDHGPPADGARMAPDRPRGRPGWHRDPAVHREAGPGRAHRALGERGECCERQAPAGWRP